MYLVSAGLVHYRHPQLLSDSLQSEKPQPALDSTITSSIQRLAWRQHFVTLHSMAVTPCYEHEARSTPVCTCTHVRPLHRKKSWGKSRVKPAVSMISSMVRFRPTTQPCSLRHTLGWHNGTLQSKKMSRPSRSQSLLKHRVQNLKVEEHLSELRGTVSRENNHRLRDRGMWW